MDAAHNAFDIGDQGMHPGERLHGLSARTGNDPFMAVGRAIQDVVSLPAVGADHCLSRQACLHQAWISGG
jgi:hypothetical protein